MLVADGYQQFDEPFSVCRKCLSTWLQSTFIFSENSLQVVVVFSDYPDQCFSPVITCLLCAVAACSLLG